MPMIVDPDAPPVTSPERVTSPDEWLAATLDTAHAGVYLTVDYTAGTPLTGAANVLTVEITRTGPDGIAVPVRSGDPAWAIGGIGAAYDHEAPLGVAVTYRAVPTFSDGTTGPTSALSITTVAPTGTSDVWIKSLDDPGLSLLVEVATWPTLTWSSRITSVIVPGFRYPAVSQDVYTAATSDMTINTPTADDINALRTLLTAGGVLLIQTRPDYHRPDQYVVLGDIGETVDNIPSRTRTYTVSVTEVERPPAADQPMRIPGWSYTVLAARYATYDAASASYATYQALSTDGII